MKAAISSGLLDVSVIVTTRPAVFYGVQIITNGTNDATVTVYSEQSATGIILAQGVVLGASQFGLIGLSHPVSAEKGIYVAISGTGAKCIVTFDHV
jgi:hypothetical protein